MADREPVENSLAPIWRRAAARLAVLAGAGTALACLLNDVPVRFAALRGALALFGVLLVSRATSAALTKAANSSVREEVRT